MKMDPNTRSAYAQGNAALSGLDSFLKENLGVTFYLGPTAEFTMGMGANASTGFYFDTKGDRGVFLSTGETAGFGAGFGGTVGFQYGRAASTFAGSGYYSYNITTPIGGASLLFEMNSGTFSGMALSTPGKPAISGSAGRTCIYGQPRSGC